MQKILKIIEILRAATASVTPPLINSIIKEYGKDSYLILIGCLLSLRAKDIVTIKVCRKLFSKAKTPDEMLALSSNELEEIIYIIGFYKNKARVLHAVSEALLSNFEGKVPHTESKLLALPGVGRKTANLVLGLAFDVPAICVDVHVHRISNRLGIIHTQTVEETEAALMKLLPKKYWIEWNKLLVMWGQNQCVPVSPFCSTCPLKKICLQKGVVRSR